VDFTAFSNYNLSEDLSQQHCRGANSFSVEVVLRTSRQAFGFPALEQQVLSAGF